MLFPLLLSLCLRPLNFAFIYLINNLVPNHPFSPMYIIVYRNSVLPKCNDVTYYTRQEAVRCNSVVDAHGTMDHQIHHS